MPTAVDGQRALTAAIGARVAGRVDLCHAEPAHRANRIEFHPTETSSTSHPAIDLAVSRLLTLAWLCDRVECRFALAPLPRVPPLVMSAASTQLTALLDSQHMHENQSDAKQCSTSQAAPRPRFDVNSEWPDRGRPLQSAQFDPLLRSALLHSIGRHRAYYPLFMLLIAVSMLLVLQRWLPALTTTVLQILLVMLVWFPVLLVECTRLDRALLRHLFGSFDFLFLMANWATCQAMVALNTAPTFSGVGSAVALNSGYFFFSLFTFGMDALPEVKPRFKIVWMCVYTAWMCVNFAHNRAQSADSEVRFCAFFCTTSHSVIASTLITQIAFAVKYLFNLIRAPNRLMIVRPHAILCMDDEARAINHVAI